jgi:hypothetical protein
MAVILQRAPYSRDAGIITLPVGDIIQPRDKHKYNAMHMPRVMMVALIDRGVETWSLNAEGRNCCRALFLES